MRRLLLSVILMSLISGCDNLSLIKSEKQTGIQEALEPEEVASEEQSEDSSAIEPETIPQGDAEGDDPDIVSDNQVDAPCEKKLVFYDGDQDGYGDPASSVEICVYETREYYTENSLDRCVGDDDALIVTLFDDADQDGFGNPELSQSFCPSADKTGFVDNNNDQCIGDNDALIAIFYSDADQDGLGNPNISQSFCPSADKTGFVDNNNDQCIGDNDALIAIFYSDADLDGLGNPNISQSFCPSADKVGFVDNSNDQCIGDNDALIVTLYRDADQDGFGNSENSQSFCPSADQSGFVSNINDQCLGEDDALIVTLFSDADEDGLGNPGISQSFCPGSDKTGFVANSDDKCIGQVDLSEPVGGSYCPGIIPESNRPPYWVKPIKDLKMIVGEMFPIEEVLAADYEGDEISYQFDQSNNCDWVILNPETGSLTGTPTASQSCSLAISAVSNGEEIVTKANIDILEEGEDTSGISLAISRIDQGSTTDQCLDSTQISISYNSPEGVYLKDSTITYTIDVTRSASHVNEGQLRIQFSDDKGSLLKETQLLLSGQRLELEVKPDFPVVLGLKGTYEGICQSSESKKVVSHGMEEHSLAIARPTDFVQYWENQKLRLDEFAMEPVVERTFPDGYSQSLGNTYSVELNNINGSKVYGNLCIPEGLSADDKVPAILELPSAGVYPLGFSGYCTSYLGAGRPVIVLRITIHDISHSGLSSEYENLSDLYYPSYLVEDRDTYYFNRVFLGLVQSLRFLKSHQNFDGEDLFTMGSSQGGGLAIIAAGLDKDVKAVASQVPALSDMRGALFGRAGGWPFLTRVSEDAIETIGYYDTAHFAQNTDAPAILGIGLLDDVTPPSSSFVTFNSFKTSDKEVYVDPEAGHNGFPGWFSIRREFFLNHISAASWLD